MTPTAQASVRRVCFLAAMSPLLAAVPLWAHAAGEAPAASLTQALTPLITAGNAQIPAPWKAVGLPDQKKSAAIPMSELSPGTIDGVPALRVATQSSYGTLVHPLAVPADGARMSWRWRLDEPLSGGERPADIRTKPGDDAALKVCVMFDQPLDRVPFGERTLLRLARSISGEDLPAATLCYLWDPLQPAGARGENPYSRRVRYVILRGSEAPLRQWQAESADVAADFRERFADELPPDGQPLPKVRHIAIGADSDNTRSHSLGWLDALQLRSKAP